MKIRYFSYNTFLIEHGNIKLAIDPGQNLWLFNLHSLIPKKEWETITHVLVTHGDPDHYWQADRVAITANAPLIINRTMVKKKDGKNLILAPRKSGLRFVPFAGEVKPVNVGDILELDGINIEAIPTQHGPIEFKIFGIKQQKIPGPNERAGFGAIGYKIQIDRRTIVNVGDSLIRKEWSSLMPDVVMLPIGGLGNNTWTMDAADALAAVKSMSPKLVIPCHYNVPFFWARNMASADDQTFKKEVEKLGIDFCILQAGDEIVC
jgi:L-ascorbate metabolism protein UlaG (beta-lactamase superfamily)